MDNNEIQLLRFRRQYLLVPEEINCPFKHQREVIGNYFLYRHTDLPFSRYTDGELDLVLLGDIFDYNVDHKSNLAILKLVAKNATDQINILSSLEPYTGSYVLIFLLNGSLSLVSDPYTTKKIFFSRSVEGIWCSSQLHLLAGLLNIGLSESDSKSAFMASTQFLNLNNSGVGSSTCYDGIDQVLPNHYLNLDNGHVKRFWPNAERIPLSVDQVVDRCVPIIKGYVSNISSRYNIMLPVTAGKDSRTLLAASREMKNEVFYYINKSKDSDMKLPDFVVPPKLAKKLNIEYHVLDTDIQVDEAFKKVYYENNPHALEEFLPIIYNNYLHFGDRVNLPGLIATGGQWWYPVFRKNKTVETLLDINNLRPFEHARHAYTQWLDDTKPSCVQSGFELLDLFYWEERLGNWGTYIEMDTDIAQMNINPFNSRMLVKIMLSVEPSYALEFASYPVNRGINMKLWPETMSMPINPGMKNSLLRIFEKLGMLKFVYRVKYR